MCFEPFLEGGETVSVSDGGGELIPPLGNQLPSPQLCPLQVRRHKHLRVTVVFTSGWSHQTAVGGKPVQLRPKEELKNLRLLTNRNLFSTTISFMGNVDLFMFVFLIEFECVPH